MRSRRAFVSVFATVLLRCDLTQSFSVTSLTADKTKQQFLDSLDVLDELNAANSERTELVKKLCEVNPTPNPGSTAAFADKAEGDWRVVYAPHMDFMGNLIQGRFAPVIYDMKKDGTIVSHARVKLPWVGAWWFSVSGTFGSENEKDMCRVNFNETWVRRIERGDEQPYPNVHAVPESPLKEIIRQGGSALFIDEFAVFPVSYLDDELIVFDFELLGTRICARKNIG